MVDILLFLAGIAFIWMILRFVYRVYTINRFKQKSETRSLPGGTYLTQRIGRGIYYSPIDHPLDIPSIKLVEYEAGLDPLEREFRQLEYEAQER